MNQLPAVFASARWIASPIHTDAKTAPPAPFFRKAFAADAEPVAAQLHITALGIYECEINGRRVGEDRFAPGWTEYHKRVFFRSYDVTHLLRRGDNAIGVILGDGWYCGKLAWADRMNYGGDRPLLLAALTLTFGDGRTQTVTTGGDWLTASGPIARHGLLEGEQYDARLELEGWSSPAAAAERDPRWGPVIVSEPPRDLAVEPDCGVPVAEHERLRPVSETRLSGSGGETRLFDLGQNFTGYARVSVRAARGRRLTLRFSEILDHGKPYYTNLRSAEATDGYICRGAETETWQPRFTFHGFRYVEAGGLDAGDELEVTGIVTHSATPPAGEFACSNRLLNQLQHNIVWGQKSNFLDVPTDCPQRDERLGWTGDAQVFIRTAAFNMDVQKFFHKWFVSLRDAQGPRGGLPCVVPNGLHPLTPQEDGMAGWSDAMVICPWTLWLCYADRPALADHYDAMRRYMDFQQQHYVRDGIRSHPALNLWAGHGDWLALDSKHGDGQYGGLTRKDLIATAYYAHLAELMAKIAAVLGRAADAQHYQQLREVTVSAFRRRFVTADGLLVSGSQTAYVLALRFNLLPENLRSAAAAELARNIREHDDHLTTGFLGTPYLLDALSDSGHLDVAYKLLEQETYPSWLFPVKHGATTIWERWDGWHPERGFQDAGMNSFNHYAYGAVGEWMVRTVAGLDLDETKPGYQHIIFRPQPGGTLTWARASLRTADGDAAIHWQLQSGTLTLNLTVPNNRTATLYPPAGYDQTQPLSLTAGRHEVRMKKVG